MGLGLGLGAWAWGSGSGLTIARVGKRSDCPCVVAILLSSDVCRPTFCRSIVQDSALRALSFPAVHRLSACRPSARRLSAYRPSARRLFRGLLVRGAGPLPGQQCRPCSDRACAATSLASAPAVRVAALAAVDAGASTTSPGAYRPSACRLFLLQRCSGAAVRQRRGRCGRSRPVQRRRRCSDGAGAATVPVK